MIDMLSSHLNLKQTLDNLFGPFEVEHDQDLKVVMITTEEGTVAAFLIDHINDWPLCLVCDVQTEADQKPTKAPRSIETFDTPSKFLFQVHLFREENGKFGISLQRGSDVIGTAVDPRRGQVCAV